MQTVRTASTARPVLRTPVRLQAPRSSSTCLRVANVTQDTFQTEVMQVRRDRAVLRGWCSPWTLWLTLQLTRICAERATRHGRLLGQLVRALQTCGSPDGLGGEGVCEGPSLLHVRPPMCSAALCQRFAHVSKRGSGIRWVTEGGEGGA